MVEVRGFPLVHGRGKHLYISVVLLLTVLSGNVLAQSPTPSPTQSPTPRCLVAQPNTNEVLCGEDFLIEWVDTNQNLSIVYEIFLNCSGINIVVNNSYPNTGEIVKNTTYLWPCEIINNKSCLVLITSGTYNCSSDTFTFAAPSTSVPTFISSTLTPTTLAPTSTPTKIDKYILIITLVAMSMVFIIILVIFLVLSSCCKRKCTPIYRIFIKCVYCSKCVGCAAICNSKSDDQNKKSKIWNIEMED